MKPASPALIALLNSGEQFIMADLYTFTLVGGRTVLRYSAAPTSIVANGYLFAAGPKFERSKTKVLIGTQVDELDIKIYAEPTDLIDSTPLLEPHGKDNSTAPCCSWSARLWALPAGVTATPAPGR